MNLQEVKVKKPPSSERWDVLGEPADIRSIRGAEKCYKSEAFFCAVLLSS